MSKSDVIQYACNACGAVFSKWSGQCFHCKEWNSIHEEKPRSLDRMIRGNVLPFANMAHIIEGERITSSMDELDRVLGGGIVRGSALLIGGDPGIGKSTLLLQIITRLGDMGARCVYVSGEESVGQISLRASRLGIVDSKLNILIATNVSDVIASLDSKRDTEFVVIDSIQTMFVTDFQSAPGTVSQVRSAAYELVTYCKERNITLILVGHITKDGQIAGPKILEHMVDVVLYFEGDRGHQFRILRAVKNRFGSVNEIGVFDMRDKGLEEVANPSSMFLTEYRQNISGCTVFAGIEGTRPILVELQALVAPTTMIAPRRAVVGWDPNRLAMIIAVLASRLKLNLLDKEVYLNVTGGLRIYEPAADLAVAAVMISAAKNMVISPDTVIFGEIGLSGEVRSVCRTDLRLKEATKLGFKKAIIPKDRTDNKVECGLEVMEVDNIRAIYEML